MLTYKEFLKINETWLTTLYDTVIESYAASFDIFTYDDPKDNQNPPESSQQPSKRPKTPTKDSTIEDLFDGIDGDWRDDNGD